MKILLQFDWYGIRRSGVVSGIRHFEGAHVEGVEINGLWLFAVSFLHRQTVPTASRFDVAAAEGFFYKKNDSVPTL